MKSHGYEFTGRDLARTLGWPLLPAVVFAVAMHWGAQRAWFPRPLPATDMDRTIVLHQGAASETRQDARCLLLGDSSCLMNVSARELGDRLGRRALNLGTLSYLDLEHAGWLWQRYGQSNPAPPDTVVILLHPESLRRAGPEEFHARLLGAYFARSDFSAATGLYRRLSQLMGLEIFRGRFWSRWVPAPIPGVYGRQYGFTSRLWRFMSEHHGSAIDPNRFGSRTERPIPEFRLSRRWEETSADFRELIPGNCRLVIGITPIPESLAPARYASLHAELLSRWDQWIRADLVLRDLPATLPDTQFASRTHLNEPGARLYTRMLGDTLSQ